MFEFLKFGKNKEKDEAKEELAAPAAENEQEETGPADEPGEEEMEILVREQEETVQAAEAQYQEEVLRLESAEKEEKPEGKTKKKKGKPRNFFKPRKEYKDHGIFSNSFVIAFIAACCINLFTEMVARQHAPVLGGLLYLIEQPLVFLANTMIIFATLSLASLFKRRTFVMCVIGFLWLLIAVANGIILTQRMTPFNMKDLTALGDGATLMTNYFTVPELIALVVGIVLSITLFVTIFLKARKREKVNYIGSIAGIILSWGTMLGLIFLLLQAGVLSTFFGSLPYAYRDYGVPYCFMNTWLNTGIHKPAGYSSKSITKLIDKEYLSKDGTMKLGDKDIASDNDDYPNILFLQLESFIDPMLFKHVAFNQDPVPNYRRLMKEYSSGSLTVPACGAGTANTECEFMTGLSMHFFGPGEYPFKSILSKEPTESIARDLGSIGYSTHAIHNHRALFYNRNEVFAQMGYDTFTSVEYMSDIQKTPKGWAKDNILISQIKDALNYTDQKDYIYTISVQGHGQYPSEKLLMNPEITVTKAPNDTAKNKYEYYANEVYEMDKFIKDLTDELSKYDEKVILVMYGDHIPALDISEENYDAKDLFQTQYIVWDNFGMKKKDMDISAFELSAEVLERVGIRVGTTTIYHQTHDHNDKNFLKGLSALGYDMIYGKHYIYGGYNPFQASDIKLGVRDIKIDKVVEVGDKYYIKGENFTEESKITLDGEPLDTVYLSSSLLGLLQKVDPEDAANMKVSQIDRNTSTIISTTE